MNDYGFMEVLPPEESKKDKGHNVGDKENMFASTPSSKSDSPNVDSDKKSEEKRLWSSTADTFYCCEACGCHGLSSEFESPISCSPACTEVIESMKEQRFRREKDIK